MRKNSHWRSSHEKASYIVRTPACRIAFRMRRRALCKGKRQETHRKLQRHRKKRLLPLSRYPQIQALPPKHRQKPPIQQFAYQMRTSTKAALLFLLSRQADPLNRMRRHRRKPSSHPCFRRSRRKQRTPQRNHPFLR